MTATGIIEQLQPEAHPEAGFYKETHRAGFSISSPDNKQRNVSTPSDRGVLRGYLVRRRMRTNRSRGSNTNNRIEFKIGLNMLSGSVPPTRTERGPDCFGMLQLQR